MSEDAHWLRWRMDIKCIFIAIFVLVLINQQEVDTRLEHYTINLCESFDDINNAQLYEFVIRPEMVNKVNWMNN